jgi:UDP-glucose 4-epimerase
MANKIAVTGGTGFIGSHLVKRLVDLGNKSIYVIGRQPHFENIRYLIKEDTTPLIWRCRKLEDYKEALWALEDGIDTVYHLAANVGSHEFLHGSPEAELYTMQTNMKIDANVFKACIENKVKTLIYTSSVSVYDMDKQRHLGAVFNETDATGRNPDGGYGWAKLITERQLEWLCQRGVNVGIARIFSAYGENEPLEKGKAHLIGDVCRKLIEGVNPLEIVGGEQTRDYLYIDDCVDCLVKIGEYAKKHNFSVFNIGSGIPTSVHEVVHKLILASGKSIYDISVNFKPIGQGNPLSRTADITRAKRFLNWQPTVSLDEGLERTYKWAEEVLSK